MKRPKSKWKKVLLIIIISLAVLIGGGYLFLKSKINEIMEAITGSKLETADFKSVIDFDYVSGWIVVKVKIEGSEKEYDFIFDSGAQTVFSDSLIKDLSVDNYRKFTVQTDTAAHSFRDEIISMNGLKIGNVEFRNTGAMIVENSEYDMLNCISPYGIIGYNILQNCYWQIDYTKKQIIITDQIESLKNLDKTQWIGYITISQETPIIQAVINDTIPVSLFFDTGYSGAVSLSSSNMYIEISTNYPEQIAKYSAKPAIVISGGKDIKSYQKMLFKASAFKIGEQLSNDLIISVEDVPERRFTGLIGNKYFENYQITLDYINKRVGFFPNRNIERDRTKETYGLSFTPSENKLIITSVYEDSEAARRGINVGDEIYSIK